ncbi:MAG TPA: hypothetical protein VHV10_11430 [Ktedonobacteraceae bacterium]|jgi:hypothetical protein|nr:hypothetical protein [Ktedonobacteraceae bacterium]
MTTFKHKFFATARITVMLLTSLMISSILSSGSTWIPSAQAHSNCGEGQCTSFPGAGHVFIADFSIAIFRLNFHSDTEMTFTVLKGPNTGFSETVHIMVTRVRPCVFIVTWKEADGSTVVHVEDFAKGIVFSNVTLPDGTFLHFKGTLTKVS